ncbi:MAG: tetratricopeptide repeat protein [Desulfobacterales bacterium]|jgi:tetratricopeptide (TPR) repeat protein|nr:tetratricopeptide repeat protein [Desulfobacterales bacterium]
MTRRKRTIARREGSRDHFLLSQTDARRFDPLLGLDRDEVRGWLSPHFPDLLWGTGLRGACTRRLKTIARFAALVLRPDPGPEADRAAIDPQAHLEAARELDRRCRKAEGFWGVEDRGLLAGLLPLHTAEEGLAAARSLQEKIRGRTGRTLTAGVAVHPTLGYAVHETLENARKALDHAAFFGPGARVAFDAVSLNISGDRHFEHGDTEAAIREFQQALALDAANVNVHNSLGVCHAVRGEYEPALGEFAAATALDANDYMAAYNTGMVHRLLGRREAALENLEKAAALRHDVFEILFQAGSLQLELGRPQAARELLERAARLRTKSGGVYRHLGDCYDALSLPEKAIAAYKKALQFNPSDPHALSGLGWLFDRKGENPEISLVFCRESVILAPENPLFHHRLGALHLKQNRLAEALAQFEAAAGLGFDAAEEIRRVRARMGEAT